MKRRQSLLALALSSLSAVAVLAGTTLPQPGSDWTVQAQTKKSLTMGTSPDYPPYEFIDTANGKIIGFDVDIVNYIGGKLGYEVTIKGMDFNGLLPALQSKRVDFVMAGMTPTEERKKNADFTDIYFQAKNTIIAKKGSNLIKPDDLASKKVGVQLGTIQEGDAKDIAKKVKGVEVVALNKISDLILEIKAGRINAAIVEDTVAKGFVASNTDLEFNVIPSDGPSGSAIAFPKGSPLVADFNKVLAEMKKNGELEKLANKWFSTTVTPKK